MLTVGLQGMAIVPIKAYLILTDLCEVDQLCSEHKGGIEGAVHTMRELFEEHHADEWGL